MKWFAFVFALPSFAYAVDTYKCSYHEQDYSAYANIQLNGTSADIVVGFEGMPETCKNTAPLTVTGQKPVLTLAGPVGCEGEDPDDVSVVLNTAKKTLEMGEHTFSCK